MTAPRQSPVHGLYVITPEPKGSPDYVKWILKVAQVLQAGAKTLQLRAKNTPRNELQALARDILAMCNAHQARLIINDDLDLAMHVAAHGVHLGQSDGSIAKARDQAPGLLIGASCYTDWQQALEAQSQGADYVAFGSVFDSSTKPQAQRADFAHFAQLFSNAHQHGLNCVAIGGITLANAPQLIQAKAHALAVISAVFDAPDAAQAVKRFNALWLTTPQ